jgi:hypothetical protein
MSVLKAPEFKPGQDIDFDEVVRMLEESTEAQEEGLTRLTDIEREKVVYILKYLGENTQAADASVRKILRTIEKYRLLLEMKQHPSRKLEGYPEPASLSYRFALPETDTQVQRAKISPYRSDWVGRMTANPNDSGWSEQEYTSGGFSNPRMAESARLAAESAASVRLNADGRPCIRLPGIAGTARGVIENPDDAFYGKTAVLRVFVTVVDIAKQSVRYTVNGDSGEMRFYASGRHIKVTRPDKNRNGLIISGVGTVHMERPDQPECTGKTAFSLAVQNTSKGLEFRMQIAALDSGPTHDSGTVKVKFAQSNMCLRMG